MNDKLDINSTFITEKIEKAFGGYIKARILAEMTPLQFAIDNNQNNIIELFLSKEINKKIDINRRSLKSIISQTIEVFEKTPLYISIEKRNIVAINALLLRTDINVNEKSFHYSSCQPLHAETALHLAAQQGDIEIIKLLLRVKNIDINIEDEQGKKPIDYSKNDEIRKLFLH